MPDSLSRLKPDHPGSAKKHVNIVYTFSKEKLEEFKDMSISQRLQWLEEANLFINKTLGFKKRAITDPRFEGLE